jgi:hypothetical protein
MSQLKQNGLLVLAVLALVGAPLLTASAAEENVKQSIELIRTDV